MSTGEKLLEILSSDKMKPEYRQLAGEVVLYLCQTEENRALFVSLEVFVFLLLFRLPLCVCVCVCTCMNAYIQT